MKTIPYSKFKHGQRVAYDFYGTKVSDGKIVKKNGMVYLYPLDIMLCTINTYYLEATSTIKNIKFLDRTLDDLEEGDVLVSKNGGERKVLGICGQVVLLSAISDTNSYSFQITKHDLKEDGYALKQEAEEQEITELTLEDVAKLANVPVEKLRIKD